MKTIDHLINKNVYYIGNNYEYFKHISRFFAQQRSKAIFISNKKEAIVSIDRELGNMRATSYAYHVHFDHPANYLKSLTRILKNRENPDILILGYKPEFELEESEENQYISHTEDSIDTLTQFYITNTIKTIREFLEIYKQEGTGTIVQIVTEESTNPHEQIFSEFVSHYLLQLNEELAKSGHSQIASKVVYKRSNISYDGFVAKLAKALDSKKALVRI